MGEEKRRHRRLRVQRAASLEVRTTSPRISLNGDGAQKTILGGSVRDLSRGGLRIATPANANLDRGATVSVKVQFGARTVAIPGNVVWFRRDEKEAFAGVRLHLELLDAASRRVIETWFAEAEKSAKIDAEAP